jgi:hypothetical protein
LICSLQTSFPQDLCFTSIIGSHVCLSVHKSNGDKRGESVSSKLGTAETKDLPVAYRLFA